MSEIETHQLYEFGPFCLDTVERVLLRDGKPLPLKPKVYETLLALVLKSGHIVDKEELILPA
jgi:DNA-binding winged helix-turn-helix (wHTH) protein